MQVGAYYFRAQMYTYVPHQVREDMAWMADHGTEQVVVGVLEQDLFAARENLDGICAEAERTGLGVAVTPSRWANLIAGCPKVSSILCAKNPDTWAARADGSPWYGLFGPVSSVHHPAVEESFRDQLRDLVTSWPVAAVIWDEPKSLHVVDHSRAAKERLGDAWSDDPALHLREQVAFLGRCNAAIKATNPDCTTGCFIYAHCDGPEVDACAAMADLDAFGCDGRPWAAADGGMGDNGSGGAPSKFLLDAGERFFAAADRHRKRSLALVENHALPAACHDLVDRRLPEVLAQGWDHLLYYYYPRSCEDPDGAMGIIGRYLRAR